MTPLIIGLPYDTSTFNSVASPPYRARGSWPCGEEPSSHPAAHDKVHSRVAVHLRPHPQLHPLALAQVTPLSIFVIVIDSCWYHV